MDRRTILRLFGSATVAAQLPLAAARAQDVAGTAAKKRGVMLMNRIAPSVSELYIANLDGSNERKLLADSVLRIQRLAFSSDRDTPWRGHHDGHGWEHTQELGIYVIRPDGSGLRKVASRPGYCLGSPKWSPDGKRIVFYEMLVEATWGARRPNYVGKAFSQIVSVDVASGEPGPNTRPAPS
jgi:Tol biopolymer transport system component